MAMAQPRLGFSHQLKAIRTVRPSLFATVTRPAITQLEPKKTFRHNLYLADMGEH
jgi:hypothetical protein